MTQTRTLMLALACLFLCAGVAHAGGKRRANMPPGWTWPPSAGMQQLGKRCKQRLSELGVRWKKAPRTQKVASAVFVPAMTLPVAGGGEIALVSTYRKPPFVMDCHLALALTERASELHELGVRELHFSSIHRYTHVQKPGNKKGALSRHAIGLAIDVWHVVDDAGIKHSVEEHYLAGDELLLEIESLMNESGAFRMVLTPANDPVGHDDHFHFEADVDYETEAEREQRLRAEREQRKRIRAKKQAKRKRIRAQKQAKRKRARARRARQARARRAQARERREAQAEQRAAQSKRRKRQERRERRSD